MLWKGLSGRSPWSCKESLDWNNGVATPLSRVSVFRFLTFWCFCAFCSSLCQCLLDSWTISSWVIPERQKQGSENSQRHSLCRAPGLGFISSHTPTYPCPAAEPSISALWRSERRSSCPRAGSRNEPRDDTRRTGREGAGAAPCCSARWLTSPRAPGT